MAAEEERVGLNYCYYCSGASLLRPGRQIGRSHLQLVGSPETSGIRFTKQIVRQTIKRQRLSSLAGEVLGWLM